MTVKKKGFLPSQPIDLVRGIILVAVRTDGYLPRVRPMVARWQVCAHAHASTQTHELDTQQSQAPMEIDAYPRHTGGRLSVRKGWCFYRINHDIVFTSSLHVTIKAKSNK